MFEKLEKRVVISYEIRTLSDMRIGAHNSTLPGELDNYVIKNSKGYPIVPGSTLKGVLRSEMERFLNSILNNEERVQELVAILFGGEIKKGSKESYASSIRFRDAVANRKETRVRDGVPIDRKTRKAAAGGKHEFEVVPEGITFSGTVIIENPRIEGHKDAKIGAFLSTVDFFNATGGSIGGGTSRGFGQVEIDIREIREFTPQDYLSGTDGTLLADRDAAMRDWAEYVKGEIQ